MCSRCFAGRYQTAVLAVASTASPTGSPKSSVKPASSRHPENGQRLAANADNSVLFVGATNLIPPVSTSSLAAGRHNRKNQLNRSIKVEVKKKHIPFGWNFSCFAAHWIE